jgi:zinc transport system substrate-binding protein
MRIIFLLFSLIFCGCQSTSRSGKPLVLVSIPPYEYFVKAIAKDLVDVYSIVPSGINAHAFEPSPRSLQTASHAFVWFSMGEHFESKVMPVLRDKSPAMEVIDLRKAISLMGKDTHFWLDPILALKQCEMIKNALVSFFPDEKDKIESNYQVLFASMMKLNRDIHAKCDPLTRRIIVTSHGSFAYFCRAYFFQEEIISLEGTQSSPLITKDLKQHLDKIAVVLIMPEFNNKGAKMFAKQQNLPLKLVDPYGKDYPKMMMRLTDAIESGAKR